MAWTAPITFTAGSTLLFSDLNTYLRDNMLQMAPAIGTTTGHYFVSSAANTLVARLPVSSRQPSQVTTTSLTYVQLGAATPTITATTGTKCLVWTACRLGNSIADSNALCSFDVSSATTQAADDNRGINIDGLAAANAGTVDNMPRLGQMDFISNLTAGSNVFTHDYRAGTSGTAIFQDRLITAMPF